MTKAALTVIIILVISSIITPILTTIIIDRRRKLKLWIKIVFPLSFILIANLCGFIGYFLIYYHSTGEVKEFLKDSDKVKVTSEINYYLFDNVDNEDTAIIFYGGAKVEEKSYAPMLNKIAQEGVDVCLVKMPLRFALFSPNKADSVYKKAELSEKYENIYLMGHSLGGVCVAMDLIQTEYEYKGIIMLASYSNKKVDDKYKALSIYGSEDTVMNRKEYEKNKTNFPSGYDVKVIEGGNHANYGYYGEQKADSKATISREEQIDLTVSYVTEFINA